MITISRSSVEFDIQVKNVNFSNEKYIPKSEHPEKIKIENLTGHIENLECKIINYSYGLVTFHYKLVMEPNIGKIVFDGNYTIYNPEKQKLALVLQNAPKAIESILKHMTYNQSIIHAEKIANDYRIYFPPR